jgi:hypothetical protein
VNKSIKQNIQKSCSKLCKRTDATGVELGSLLGERSSLAQQREQLTTQARLQQVVDGVLIDKTMHNKPGLPQK